jgi:hypothetical protein
MGATLDNAITVNILSAASRVGPQGFGTILHATDEVEVGFTELWREYESNNEAQNDADLKAPAKAAIATLFSQQTNPGVVRVGKVAWVSLATDLDAIEADDDGFYGLVLESRTQADLEAAAAWALANSKLFCGQTSDAAVLAGTAANVMLNIQATNNARAATIYHADDTEYLDIAWWAGKLAADPDEQATIFRYYQPDGITVDDMTSTEKSNIFGADGNVYLPFAGIPATGEGVLSSSDPIDTTVSKDWLEARVFEAAAQKLLDASARNEKIPYTDAGIAVFEDLVREVIARGIRAQHIRDDEGFEPIVFTPRLEDVPQADFDNRLVRVDATVWLAGAIEEATFNIAVLI